MAIGPLKFHISNAEKTKAVLRILAGEDIHAVAAGLQIAPDHVERWKAAFLAGGEAAIEKQSEERHASHRNRLSSKTKAAVLQWTGALIVLFIVIYLVSRALNVDTGQ